MAAPLRISHDGFLLKQILGLVPAAGVGTRMGADRPKQYLPLGEATVLERAVRSLLADPRVAVVAVVVAPGDDRAARLNLPRACRILPVGGATRADSVRNGLRALGPDIAADAWILVHDAARPCLAPDDLAALIDAACVDDAGALLAVPVSDTVKRVDGGRVAATVDRTGLWRALTPQCFRRDVLARALAQLPGAAGFTDEASAVEALGLRPRVVAGAASNIKITTPADLALAEALLRAREPS